MEQKKFGVGQSFVFILPRLKLILACQTVTCFTPRGEKIIVYQDGILQNTSPHKLHCHIRYRFLCGMSFACLGSSWSQIRLHIIKFILGSCEHVLQN